YLQTPSTPELDTLSLHDALPISVEGEAGLLGFPAHDVEIGIGDELQPHRDQRVVDLALALELVLVLVLLGKRVLHLLEAVVVQPDRKSTRLNSSHVSISYAVFCL